MPPWFYFANANGLSVWTRQEDGDDDDNDGSTNKELQLKEKEAADAKKAKQEELWSAFKKETAHEPVSKPVSSTMVMYM